MVATSKSIRVDFTLAGTVVDCIIRHCATVEMRLNGCKKGWCFTGSVLPYVWADVDCAAPNEHSAHNVLRSISKATNRETTSFCISVIPTASYVVISGTELPAPCVATIRSRTPKICFVATCKGAVGFSATRRQGRESGCVDAIPTWRIFWRCLH